MHNNQATDTRQELYVVEVDGVKKSEHRLFVEALKCGMELKIRHPRSKVKLRDADNNAPPAGVSARRRTWGLVRHTLESRLRFRTRTLRLGERAG